MEKSITIKVDFTVSYQDIDDIIVGCLEGGSNYWIWKAKALNSDFKGAKYLSEIITKGGRIVFTTFEEEEFVLGLNKMKKGLKQYAKEKQGINPEEMDADDYDSILQYALFNELVYG